jgi:threonine dehydratase
MNAMRARQERGQTGGGVLTFSSGNHAQAMARAGQILGVPVTVVMPNDAPEPKRRATESYGAQVVLYDKCETSREALGAELAERDQLEIIPPYDHFDIIAGQGTAAKELIEEVGSLDYLIVCVGGGGLLSGSALSAKALCPDCQVIGAEPAGADDAYRTFREGTIQTCMNPQTIADGARTPYIGKLNWEIIRRDVTDIIRVEDDDLLATMAWIWQRMKVVLEPTGALAATAISSHQIPTGGKRMGVILSGGNADVASLTPAFG